MSNDLEHSLNLETEKMALMPPKSPCLSSNVVNTIQRQRLKPIPHHLSNDNETLSTSIDQSQDQHSRHHHTKNDTDKKII